MDWRSHAKSRSPERATFTSDALLEPEQKTERASLSANSDYGRGVLHTRDSNEEVRIQSGRYIRRPEQTFRLSHLLSGFVEWGAATSREGIHRRVTHPFSLTRGTSARAELLRRWESLRPPSPLFRQGPLIPLSTHLCTPFPHSGLLFLSSLSNLFSPLSLLSPLSSLSFLPSLVLHSLSLHFSYRI